MQSNRPPPYSTQLSPQQPGPPTQPQTQYGYPLQQQQYPQPPQQHQYPHPPPPQQQYPQQNPYPYGPPPRATGVPAWVWILLAVVVVGFFGLTAVVATAMAIAKSNAADKAPIADTDSDPTPAPRPAKRGKSALPPVERHVPVHDVTILQGCSSADISTIERRLDSAIKVGAPSYNAGNFEGCYSTYDSAAAKLELALSNTCTGPVTALESGRRTARAKDSPSDRAWAMRDSFDGLFDVINRSEQ